MRIHVRSTLAPVPRYADGPSETEAGLSTPNHPQVRYQGVDAEATNIAAEISVREGSLYQWPLAHRGVESQATSNRVGAAAGVE